MKILFLTVSLLLSMLPLARAAAPVVTNIANFPSVSVAYTNYVSEQIVTNGLTLGGVRNTSWPAQTNAAAANPTATVSTSVVNGTATTFMRSDSAPALSQAIAPVWTGQHIYSNSYPQVLVKISGSNAVTGQLKFGNAGTRIQSGAYDVINNEICNEGGVIHMSRNLIITNADWATEQAGSGALIEVGQEGLSFWGVPTSPAGTAINNLCFMQTAGITLFPGEVGIGYANGTSTPLTTGIRLAIKQNHNFGTGQLIVNTNTTGGAYELLLLTQDPALGGHYGGIYNFNSGYTTSGLLIQDSFMVDAGSAGGMTLLAEHASGVIRFGTGGSTAANERMRILSTGLIGIGTTAPTSTLHVAGSQAHSIATGTAFTLTATNEVYLVNVDAQTVTLPTAVGVRGRTYTIKAIAPATTGTIATTSSQTIDGSTTYSLSASNKYVRVISDNAAWWVIGSN